MMRKKGKQPEVVPSSYAAHIHALLDKGELITAAFELEARQSAHSHDPDELIAFSRLMGVRGRHGEAIDALERAAGHPPAHQDAVIERARYAAKLGDLVGADRWFGYAWRTETQGQAWVTEWLDVLMRLGQREAAQRIARAHCARAPQHAEGWFWLGYALHQKGHEAEALEAYQRCEAGLPKRPMLRNNMAAAYMDLKDLPSAQRMLEQTLADEPENALAWTNLASLLLRRREIGRAQVAGERALVLAPDYPTALQVHSYVLKELQQWDLARTLIERAHALRPTDASIHWSLAMLQLIHGDYARGWVSHESRWAGSDELHSGLPVLPAPVWQGEPLAGKTLLIWGEQGHGDALQFVRFVPAVADRLKNEGGQLIYCCFPNLMSLFVRSLADSVDIILPSTIEKLPSIDYHLPLASLPLRLGITVDDLAAWNGPYLKADPAQVERWSQRCASGVRLKVGLVWSGSRTHQRNPMRSIDPVMYAQAFGGIENIEFHNLQVDAAGNLQAMRAAGLEVVDHTAEFCSFDDTAAYLRQLDLVITVCTSVAHLAGALGVPTWLRLDVNPHWVWMTERSDSPWYASLKLYRQPAYAQWEPALKQVAADLRQWACESALPNLGCVSPGMN